MMAVCHVVLSIDIAYLFCVHEKSLFFQTNMCGAVQCCLLPCQSRVCGGCYGLNADRGSVLLGSQMSHVVMSLAAIRRRIKMGVIWRSSTHPLHRGLLGSYDSSSLRDHSRHSKV